MTQLVQTISKIKKHINPNLNIDGVLLTLADMQTNIAKVTAQTLQNTYGGQVKIYKTIIPHGVKTIESSAKGKSIYAHDKSSKPARAYEEFAKEVLQQNERYKTKPAKCR